MLRVTVYTPESPLRQPSRLVRTMFADLVASRELAWRLFVRDLSAQYRSSLFGYLVTPLVTTTCDWLTTGAAPDVGGFIAVTTVTVAFLLFGWVAYRLALPHLIERLGN